MVADGQRVRLTGEVTTQRPRTDLRAEQPQQGPNCVGEVPGEVDSPFVLAHQPPPGAPALDPDEVPSDRWMWAQVTVGGTTHAPVLCDRDGTCPEDGTSVVRPYPAQRPDRTVGPATVTALVRRTDDGVRLVLPADDDVPVPSGADGVLPVPPVGEAVPTVLDDGAPVFVTHTPDGEVHVLDASSRHFATDLVAACPTRGATPGGLSDWAHATWDLAGGYIGGPGQGDLRRYPATRVEVGGRLGVRVTGELEPPRGRQPTAQRRAVHAPCVADEMVRHTPPSPDGWISEVEELPQDTRGWRWVRARTVEVDGERLLCSSSGCDVAARPIATDPAHLVDEPRPVLVRGRPGSDEVEVREPVPDDGTSPGTSATPPPPSGSR